MPAGELLRRAATEVGVAPGALEVLAQRAGRLVTRAGDVVVKVCAEAGGFAAEARAVRLLGAAGLPVARVRVVRDGPPGVIVLDWTPGRAVRADDDPGVRRQVVDLLTRVHRLPARPPYGGTNPDLVTWIDGWSRHALHRWARSAGGDDVRAAGSWYRRVRPLVAGRAGSLVLLDGAAEHFVVGPDGRVRLIDVAELQPGDPVMDLAVLSLATPAVLAGVLDHYHQSEVTAEHLTELLPFHRFLRALAAADWATDVRDDPAAGAAWRDRAAAELARATSGR
ncbi:hypothetical protein [Micromonospora auratinigra]|uniref:Phosphotransferase enzyme family protein n=1 Tax=Micromonospora auratinigra TaxID=261654 RepID=A0A1A9A615_9ACTN|nr:hypothetical protein [Micromonospora auratinigra]SBT51617.1 hypothetical protein GA0070611_5255 [Micromonospora auratinigra]